MKRVVIVGGGITGLAAAHALEKSEEHCEVQLLEASARLGGNITTLNHAAFTIDGGPDSWVATKPHATRLAKEVGLGDELIGTRPDTRKVFIVWQRQLHPMPEGLVLGIPTEWKPFAASDLFGWDTKLRCLLEPLVPKKRLTGSDDESIGAFIARRLGADIAERVANPLLGGIFAGDADQLSVRACVPQLVEAEEKYGSLMVAMKALREKRKEASTGGDASTFISLKRGMGDLITTVAHRLQESTDVATSRAAKRVSRLEGDPRGRWAIETEHNGTLFADHVALTVPTQKAAKLVQDLDPGLAAMLSQVHYVSTATVFLAFRKYDVRHPLDAVGFLVPKAENRPILACTFVSSKWEHRAPSGQVLLRVFVGGAGNEHVLQRDDASLVRLAREQVLDLLGIERAPVFSKVFRFSGASPQPVVGHLARMEAIAARVRSHDGLYVGGNGYVGTGIPDAIKQGEEIAMRIAGASARATVVPAPADTSPAPIDAADDA